MDELKHFRNQIDEIDNQLINLLFQRFQIVKQIWEFKKQNNIPPLQPWRRKEVLKNIKTQWTKLGLDEIFIETIWNHIHDYALNLEK